MNDEWDFSSWNWGMIGILLGTIGIWYAIFKIGFFPVLMWVIIGAAIGGIVYKIKEMRW